MADNEVDILLKVQQEGADSLDQVNQKIKNVGETTQQTATRTDSAANSTDIFTRTMGKQIPALGDLFGAIGKMSLGTAGLVAGVAALGVEAMKDSQSLMMLTGNIAILGATQNAQTYGPLQSNKDTLNDLLGIQSKWGGSIAELTDAYAAMNPKVTGVKERLQLMNEAEQISVDTGIPLKDVVKALSDALAGDSVVRDKNTGAILLGNDALQQMKTNLESQKDPILSVQNGYKKLADEGLEDLKLALGRVGTALLDVLLSPIVLFDMVTKHWSDFASGIKTIFEWPLNWVINRINDLIGLINKIPGVHIPSIPNVGGSSFVPGSGIPHGAPGGPSYSAPYNPVGATNITINVPNGVVGMTANDLTNFVQQQLNDYLRARTAY